MNASPLGFAVGVTQYDEHPHVLEWDAVFPAQTQASCGSGDGFCVDYDAGEFHVDMEAHALSKVCRMEGVAFGWVKGLSFPWFPGHQG
jgi:adenosylhomocysteine nucleosidase